MRKAEATAFLLLLLCAATLGAPDPVPAAPRGVTVKTGLAAARARFLAPGVVRNGPGAWRGIRNLEAVVGEGDARADGQGVLSLASPDPEKEVLLAIASPGFVPVLIGPRTFRDGESLAPTLRRAGRLEGRVIDADGKPVVGARVLFLEEPPPGWLEGSRPALRGFTAESTEEGQFHRADLPDGPFLVVVRAGEQGTLLIEGRWLSEAPLELRLPRPATVGGTIRAEPDGRPVVGARIVLRPLASDPFREPREAVTDKAGRWRLTGLPEAGFAMEVVAKGMLDTRPREVVPKAGEDRPDIDATLRALGGLAGRVVTATTDPIAGAEIFIAYPPGNRDYPVPDPDRPVGVTDEVGTFQIADLAPDIGLRVTIRAKGLAPQTIRDVSIAGGDPTVLAPVILGPGALVKGTVTAAEAPDTPLAGVRVIAVPSDIDALTILTGEVSSRHPRTVTAEDGTFLLDGLAEGNYRLAAFRDDRLPTVTDVLSLQGPEGKPVDRAISLGLGASLAGEVVAPDGSPVGGAEIRATPEDGGPVTHRTTSAADGTFRLSGLPHGSYAVAVSAEGYARLRRGGFVPDRPERLVLGRLGALEGRVVSDRDGAPLPPFSLAASRRIESEGNVPGPVGYEAVAKGRFRAEDGVFRLEGLDPGLYRLEAVVAGGRTGYAEGIRVTGGETVAGLVIRTTLSGTLAGRVVRWSSGRPVEGARVSVLRPGSPEPSASALTDPDGVFGIPSVAAGPITVIVRARDLAPVRRDGVRVLSGLTLRLDDFELDGGAALRVAARSVDGRALAGASFALESLDDGGRRREVTDLEGVALFDLLRPGAYRLWRETGEGALSGWIVRVEAGPPTEIRVDPGREVRLEGTVSRAGGPVPGARIELVRAEDARSPRKVSRATSDAEGEYAIPDALVGEQVLRIRTPGGATRQIPVTIPSTPVHRLDLTLPEEGLLVEVSMTEDGEPVEGATVLVRRRGGDAGRGLLAALALEAARGRTDAAGRYRVDGLDPGVYAVEVFRDGLARGVAEVAIRVGAGVVMLEVGLGASGVLSGQVLDLRQEPVPGAVIVVRDAAGRPVTLRERIPVGSDGRFRVDGLPTGTYRIQAEAPGHARETRWGLPVVPGSETTVDLHLQEEGRLRVTVFGPGGVPLRGAAVEILDAFENLVWPPREDPDLYRVYGVDWLTDSGGDVRVRGLPSGVHVVRASRPGLKPFSVRVLVQGGVETRSAVVLLPD